MDWTHEGRLWNLRLKVLLDVLWAEVSLLNNSAVPFFEEIKDGEVGTKQIARRVIPLCLLLLTLGF